MISKVFFRSVSLVCLLATISAVFTAQQPVKVQPSVDKLRTHVEHLASDALEGRRTGTPGADQAAEYIAREFARLGLIEGAKTATASTESRRDLIGFFQYFPYVAGVELGKHNAFTFSPLRVAPAEKKSGQPVSLVLGDDWIPLGVSTSTKLKDVTALFVGYGITASELNHDDYAGKDIAGKIAIARNGTPEGDYPHGRFSRHEDIRWKAIAARNAGAKALVVISKEEELKEDRLAQLRYDNSAGDSGLPVVIVSRKAALRLLSEESGSNGNDLEKALEQAASQPVARIDLSTDLVRRESPAKNVVGLLEGTDPTLKREAIVIGAHYDHLGRGGAGSLAVSEGEIHHGADDNASGVASMLELARMFSTQGPKPRRSIVFIGFGGEEEGLLGSKYYVNNPIVPLADTVAMFNLDMVGRMKANKLIIGGVGTAQEWRSSIEEAQKRSAEPGALIAGAGNPVAVSDPLSRSFDLTLTEDGFGPSDHSSFYGKKIPVLFFWTGTHADYHKPSDTAEKINYSDQARVVSLVGRLAAEAAQGKRLTYAVARSESTGRSMGFRVYLGTVPSYGDSNDGLLLDGIRDDSPAAMAGLKAGDRIVLLAGREVRNINDYTYVLGQMKAGQQYQVEVIRGAERLKFTLTPAERK